MTGFDRRSIRLKVGAFVSVGLAGCSGGSLEGPSQTGPPLATRTLELEGVGVFTFSFEDDPEAHVLLAKTTADPETEEDFAVSAAVFQTELRSPYEVRLNAGFQPPGLPVHASIMLPAELLGAALEGSNVQILAQVLQDASEDLLFNFELFDSEFDGDSAVTVTLPPEVFSTYASVDDTYEAIIVLGAAPVARLDSAREIFAAPSCKGASLGSPLENRQVTDGFNGKNHKGTDYRASTNTPVKSMADGVVVAVGNQRNAKKLNRLGMPSGWGNYVLVRHSDGGMSVYSHLGTKDDGKSGIGVKDGDRITKGQQLGTSGNTGGASGPHLHVEYAPDCRVWNDCRKVDPEACIEEVDCEELLDEYCDLVDKAISLCPQLIAAGTALSACMRGCYQGDCCAAQRAELKRLTTEWTSTGMTGVAMQEQLSAAGCELECELPDMSGCLTVGVASTTSGRDD